MRRTSQIPTWLRREVEERSGKARKDRRGRPGGGTCLWCSAPPAFRSGLNCPLVAGACDLKATPTSCRTLSPVWPAFSSGRPSCSPDGCLHFQPLGTGFTACHGFPGAQGHHSLFKTNVCSLPPTFTPTKRTWSLALT